MQMSQNNNNHNSNKVSLIILILTLFSSFYPILKDFYISFFDSPTIVFEELSEMKILNDTLFYNNIFNIEEFISPVNKFLGKEIKELPENTLALVYKKSDNLNFYRSFIMSQWVIKNSSKKIIKNDMFHKKIQCRGINSKILTSYFDNDTDFKVEYDKNNDSFLIDNVLLNPHEKVNVVVLSTPTKYKTTVDLNWDCHIEGVSTKIKKLSRNKWLGVTINLQLSQIIQLVIVFFLVCILHTILLEKGGYFFIKFGIAKKIIWTLCGLCHLAFAECIAYLNLSYLVDSPANWNWISISVGLEILSFGFACFLYYKNRNKKNNISPLSNFAREICFYCRDPRSLKEIIDHIGINKQITFKENVLQPLLEQKLIEL